jgi:hypothetical protein
MQAAHTMTRTHYQSTARKMHWLITAWSVLFIIPVVLLIHALGPSIQSFGHTVRSSCDEILGGFIGGLVLGVPPLFGWLAVALFLDRQFGIRCPHCHRSLTARSLPRRVLDTGECSLCHARVFDENAAS